MSEVSAHGKVALLYPTQNANSLRRSIEGSSFMGARRTFSAVVGLAIMMLPTMGSAQEPSLKDRLIGTWIIVSATDIHKDGTKTEAFGPSPLGTIMFDRNGRFAQILMRSDLPKTASRSSGTPEQDHAVVAGSNAYYGTYSVDEGEKALKVHYDGSTFAALIGRDVKRIIESVTADELRLTNPTTSTGPVATTVWRRAK